MNKYHNRNRIISPIMTIHDILTLHILSSFLPLSFSFFSLFPFSFLSLSFLSSLFPFSPSLFSPLSSLSLLLSFFFSPSPFFLPFLFSLSSIVKGADYLTIQTSSVIVPGCPNDGEQTYMALFSHAYLLSAGASKRGAALK